MERIVRCQAVILKDNNILVLRQYNHWRENEYWMLPGGSLEAGETEEECIRREIREEVNLEVELKGILFDEPGIESCDYEKYVTFLCIPLANSIEMIGYETDSNRQILDLVWCSLMAETEWNKYLLEPHFYPTMKQIQERLTNLGVIKYDGDN